MLSGITGGKVLQRHPQSLSEGFLHIENRLHRSDKSDAVSSTEEHLTIINEENRICEAERKHRECKAKTNGPPADSLTMTCFTCSRQEVELA